LNTPEDRERASTEQPADRPDVEPAARIDVGIVHQGIRIVERRGDTGDEPPILPAIQLEEKP
jgi:hypothetical protein